jgi:predicted RNase H-like nuclease
VTEGLGNSMVEFMRYAIEHPVLSKISEDCIDALCLAVTGKFGLKNGFRPVPENPMLNNRGIPMQMVYVEI